MMEYLDGLPLVPVLVFGLGYLALLVTVLAWVRSRRPRCEKCGGVWLRTERGNEIHVCVLPEMECSSYCVACKMRDGLHAPFCKAFRP